MTGILCFKFPEELTTPDFRQLYTPEMVENLMSAGIILTFLFGLISLLLSKSKKYAVIGVVLGGTDHYFRRLHGRGTSCRKSKLEHRTRLDDFGFVYYGVNICTD